MIKNRIKQLIEVDWQNLKAIQPEDVKIQNNLEALKASLIKHGFSLPFAVWIDGADIYTIDGHTRKKALQELQAEGVKIPDKLKAFEIEAKNRKEAVEILVEVFNQKHNPFDNEVLINWLDVEQVEIQDLEAVNLSSPIIEKSEAQEDDFEIPDEDEIETDIKLGDLIEIGRHRLLCGDSTDSDAVAKLMNGEKADMVFTDPPYNVAFNGRSGKFDVIENDDLPENEFEDLINGFVAIVKILNPKNYYVWCNWKFYGVLQSKLEFKSCIVWAKNVFGLGCGYRHQHEFCLFNGRVDDGINNESDLWSVKKDINHLHPTQKPIELAARALNNHKGDKLIVDLFSGSGLTFIASHQLNRKCYGMELDPKYCQVIIDRMLNSYPDIEVKINGHKYQQLQTV